MGEFPNGLRVALVHDWLTGMRGGEKCLEVMAEIFPEAPLFTLLHVPDKVSRVLEARPIHTSCIQKLPQAERIYRWALPLFPRAIENFDFDDFDLVLSSSHCVAKSAIVRSDAVSVSYCYTPMRYVWDRFDDYFGDKPFPAKQLIGWQASRLRRWDKETSSRVDHWIAISHLVQNRIIDWYGVSPDKVNIVYPPVDVGRFQGAGQLPVPAGLVSGGYDLVVSALVAYKKIDLAVKAALVAGRTLVVVGKGPELARLQEVAKGAPGKGKIVFAGPVSDADLPAYYGHCRCFVFPGLEDFGITPLEATAAGRPVVAYGIGGVLDTITEGLNGFFFNQQSVEALADALADDRLSGPWDEVEMAAHVASFSRERYRREMISEIQMALGQYQGKQRG